MNDLLKTALVGTARNPAPPVASPHPTDALVNQLELDSDTPEDRLLLTAGVRTVFDQAGRRAEPLRQPLVAPAPPEQGVACSEPLRALLVNIFAAGTHELLPEFLGQMRESRILLPHELLPKALETREPRLRELLRPVVGERGKWLSQFQPGWSWVTAGDWALAETEETALRDQFLEGTVSERCTILARLHAARPEVAISWLEEIWQQEKADVRRQLLESLSASTVTTDEPFLEQALRDRSQHVRNVAAGMLSTLPDSQLALRMRQRGDALLLRDAQSAEFRLSCQPPTELPDDWKQDGIPEKVPRGVGRRAYWTEFVLRAIPPSHWSEQFDTDPQSLIDATEGDAFAISVLRGWTEAACTCAGQRTLDPQLANWLPALFRFWVDHASGRSEKAAQQARDTLSRLLEAMSTQQAEHCLLECWEGQRWRDSVVPPQIVSDLTPPWSVEFAKRYLGFLRRIFRNESGNITHQWANTLHTAARCIPREVFAAAMQSWDLQPSGSSRHADSVRRETQRFLETIRLRTRFFEEIPQ